MLGVMVGSAFSISSSGGSSSVGSSSSFFLLSLVVPTNKSSSLSGKSNTSSSLGSSSGSSSGLTEVERNRFCFRSGIKVNDFPGTVSFSILLFNNSTSVGSTPWSFACETK